ncbi:Predicted metal-dependent hydrolase, TIM-barrel fold [Parafrankia irregularis]|uniref:Predicted metal-dependent hydrolase, TIM-barrel fold n=1 Tax=Parafrankia irregularis TaxID=795642 RepID=A0A0S4QWY1_9ACTN|nr:MULTISPECIES: amidohydrolase family protein [Parafrankia]MBE3201542.1 amidohydrolase family protein [Parafrankia sp. CH37]CUU59388.1 Predicted metal-dependent hydrolase, TIM-barrel fold [Parafrankia irregularis]
MEAESATTEEPVVIVSADCHAGAPLLGYRDYLPRTWHDDFDSWSRDFVNPWSDLDEVRADRNWNSAKRLGHLDEDGIVAEVIFPNTNPPFCPQTALVAGPPTAADYPRRWAGLKAHNRWLADFCREVPGRRAGIAQVLFNEPDEAVREITWARENGLTGGILLPPIPPGAPIPPIWDESYEPIWAACADLDIPINHHGGSGSPDYGGKPGMARLVYLQEFTFYSHRNLWLLIWSGLFERHPTLRYVVTEQSFEGVLNDAMTHDGLHSVLTGKVEYDTGDAMRELVGPKFIESLGQAPSGFLRENIWFGVSFMRAADAGRRHEAGVERMMWGSDYPHTEGTWPDSRGSIAAAVAGVPPAEARRILGLNAIDFYRFDAELLTSAAAELGPTPAQLGLDPDEAA